MRLRLRRVAAMQHWKDPKVSEHDDTPRPDDDFTSEPPELGLPPGGWDRYSTQSLDRAAKAHLARFTLGVTPFGLSAKMINWWLHLAGSPGKQLQLGEKAARKAIRLAVHAAQTAGSADDAPCIRPLPHDRRFSDPGWARWPYNLIYQNFLLTQQWWYNATNDVDGLSPREEAVVSFVARQMLDTISPSNFVATNPELARITLERGGTNLAHGLQHFLEDWQRSVSGKPPPGAEDYRPGRDVAVTEGQVVYRTHLLELIQYSPKTENVAAEPILITPAWIMKYYILDLSPENSLVKYLVEQGFTVFMISWRNPDAEDRDQGMADYLAAQRAAIDAVAAIVPERRIHAIGYCLGGTLLSTQAAAMARDGDDRLATLTLLATQTDFAEPGELQLFISESEVSFLENMMWDQGYLDTTQMAGAFQLLRSHDLIWSRFTREYLLGERAQMFDLMAWNADATRLPYRMHSDYLRDFFLDNKLAHGQYRVGGAPVALRDIDVPMFCVSTTGDHIAPWHSVYKLHLMTDAELTFVLTTGGHNAGIVSEPGRSGRRFSIRTRTPGENYTPPEDWREEAPARDGSWWPELVAWLQARSTAAAKPPKMGSGRGPYRARGPAPGSYVLQR